MHVYDSEEHGVQELLLLPEKVKLMSREMFSASHTKAVP